VLNCHFKNKIMKKIILLLLPVLFLVSACEDILEEKPKSIASVSKKTPYFLENPVLQ